MDFIFKIVKYYVDGWQLQENHQIETSFWDQNN